VWRALPAVMSQPAVTVNVLAERLGISKPAAQTAIDQMVAAGVLAPANSFRRNRVWVAGEVVEALDEFAVRAGRRRFAAG
jgi:DNA-binding MarR family transcriptional regulator